MSKIGKTNFSGTGRDAISFMSNKGNRYDLVLVDGTMVVYENNRKKATSATEQYVIENALSNSGSNFRVVNCLESATKNGILFQSVYNEAKASTPNGAPLGTTNRITIAVTPGHIASDGPFLHNTSFIDIVSLDGNCSVRFTNGITVSANDTFLKGLDATYLPFAVATNLSALVLENCKGGDGSFCGGGANFLGKMTDCVGGDGGFAAFGEFAGTAIRCTGGANAFGGCGIFRGTAIDCVGAAQSFGGTYDNGVDPPFVGSFTAAGIAIRCTGAFASFGGDGGIFAGTAKYCTGAKKCFGGDGTFSGFAFYCISDEESFGGAAGGVISATARLYYCKLLLGAFNAPAVGGKLVLCINGSDAVITTV